MLLIRARLSDEALAGPFDDWYAREHLPLAAATLHATRALRFWSTTDPSVHFALYEFDSGAVLAEQMAAPGFASLVEHFDQRWAGLVERTREVLVAAQTLPEEAP